MEDGRQSASVWLRVLASFPRWGMEGNVGDDAFMSNTETYLQAHCLCIGVFSRTCGVDTWITLGISNCIPPRCPQRASSPARPGKMDALPMLPMRLRLPGCHGGDVLPRPVRHGLFSEERDGW